MKLEVLMSCMNQKDFSILDKANIHSDVLIVNQCDKNEYKEEIRDGYLCRMISTKKRGLSQSRNECLNNMNGDIGIICDDDIIYYKNYPEVILNIFNMHEDIDILIFDMEWVKNNEEFIKNESIAKNTVINTKNIKLKKSSRFKNYCSVRIAFRKKSIVAKNIWFNLNFGSGSKKYLNGEDSIFIRDAKRHNLKIYEYDVKIGKINCFLGNSTWFKGYDEKYFYDKGALVKELYPYLYFVFKYYYVIKLYKSTNLSMRDMLRNINNGIKGYKKSLDYDEFKIGEKKCLFR